MSEQTALMRMWRKVVPPNLVKSKEDYSICNVRERQASALSFLEDWVTSVVGLETAAIGALGLFVTVGTAPELGFWPSVFLTSTLVFLVLGLISGMCVLFMLPAAAQRVPKPNNDPSYVPSDIYAIWTYHKTPILFYAYFFWLLFLLGVVSFAIFAGLQVWSRELVAEQAEVSLEEARALVEDNLELLRQLRARLRLAGADP
jgi:hypothetical protein